MRVATLAITLVGVAAAHGADELPPAFAAVMEATVWVKARTADGRAGANVSGFVARVDKEHAWVVTDETAVRAVSVIGGRDGGRTLRPGATLTVVYRPGAKDEEAVPAAVAATGGVRGLVLLRLPLAKDQPAALKFGTAEDAPVGTPLYSFGGSGEVEPEKEKVPGWVMPLGVGRGTVTTTPAPGTADKLMTEVPEKGNVFHVGGPVVTRAGAVVGVGFMKFGVLGQSTPAAKVFDLVRPQMSGFTWEEAGVTPAGVKVRFVARFNDPFGTLTGATFRFKSVPGESGRPRPPRPPFVEDANVPPIDADWSLEVPVLANTATATITWKPGTDAKPLRYLAQVTYCDAKGVEQAGRVETVAVAFPPPGSAPPVAQLPDTGDLRIDAEYRPLGGATAATAMSENERFLPTLVWERGGKAFFVATASGRLWKLGYPDLKPLGQLDLQGACAWLTASKAGIIATVTGRREAWVIDPGTLKVGRKFDIGESVRVASAPPLGVAFVGPGGTRSALTVYDLTAGKAVQEYLPADMKRRGAMFDDVAASPDGKFLFSANGHTAFSWQVKENEVLATDVTRGTADLLSGVRAGFGQFAFSAGGMVAAVGNGNPPADPEERGTGVNVYAVDDLSKPVLRIATGQHPKSLAFDPKTGDIYAHNVTTPLLVFDAKGKPAGSHEFPFLPRHRTTHLSAHPDGGGVLVLTEAMPKRTGAITSVRFAGGGAVAKPPVGPRKEDPKTADPTEYVRVGEMAVARLPLNRNETGLLPCMTWNRKATAFFTLSVTGELRRYTYPVWWPTAC